MKVLKFGGTSLGDAAHMRCVSDIVSKQGKVFVVLSAVSGTTNALVDIVSALKNDDKAWALTIVEKLSKRYLIFISDLDLSGDKKAVANDFIQQQLADIIKIIETGFIPSLECYLLAKGELISTEIFYLLLQEQGKNCCLINALDFLRLDQDNTPDEKYLALELSRIVAEQKAVDIIITQGFICRNAFGGIGNLERGGSDYSASLFGAALNCEEIQIWTDIDGMQNNDPRYVKNTKSIRALSFNEAAELAYFGAKILHPSSIKPARKKNIPVKLLNTIEPDASGTLISNDTEVNVIKAVAAKSGITAIKIRSSEMLQAPGFLRKIFEIFELYQTSIDMITTSEVAVSVTIDDNRNLVPIVKTLAEFAHVEIDEDLSIICVVGENIIDNVEVVPKVVESIKGLAIRMISYGGSAHNISLLVSESVKNNALGLLHEGLFNV